MVQQRHKGLALWAIPRMRHAARDHTPLSCQVFGLGASYPIPSVGRDD
jgi:hypothetical protein